MVSFASDDTAGGWNGGHQVVPMQLATPTGRPDSRLYGGKTHGSPEDPRLALEARRQATFRRMRDPADDLRHRVVELDVFSVAVLAERDLPDIDYASGAGY